MKLILGSDTELTLGRELILNGATDSNPSVTISKRDIRWTCNMNIVMPGGKWSNFPFQLPVDVDDQPDVPVGLILAQRRAVVRGHGDAVSVNKRRPNICVFVALVSRQYGCVVSDLLVPISGKDVEFIVENSNFGIRVMRINSDLKIRGEEIGKGCDIESVNGCVLEDETRFFGL